MRCDRCGERDATIHEVVINSGDAVERHLCEGCAQEIGLTASSSTPLNELLAKFVQQASDDDDDEDDDGPEFASAAMDAESDSDDEIESAADDADNSPAQKKTVKPAASPGLECPSCGLPYSEFKQTGLLGCSECYSAFQARLGPLIERAHDGGAHHTGKLPVRALKQCEESGGGGIDGLVGGIRERTERAASLREQLQRAIEAEKYEVAAGLRDELSKITAGGGAGGGIDDAADEATDGGAG